MCVMLFIHRVFSGKLAPNFANSMQIHDSNNVILNPGSGAMRYSSLVHKNLPQISIPAARCSSLTQVCICVHEVSGPSNLHGMNGMSQVT